MTSEQQPARRDDTQRGVHAVSDAQVELILDLEAEGMEIEDIRWVTDVSATMLGRVLKGVAGSAREDSPARRLARLVVKAQDDARKLSARARQS